MWKEPSLEQTIQDRAKPLSLKTLQANFGSVKIYDYLQQSELEYFQGPKTAYLLMAHNNKTLCGLTELLTAIYRPYNLYVIHIDAKVPNDLLDWFQGSVDELFVHSNTSNIIYLAEDDRVNVTWGTYSIVQAELNLLRHAHYWNRAQDYDSRWEIAINLCGESYLVHSMPFIENALSLRLEESIWKSSDFPWLGWFENLDPIHTYRANKTIPIPGNQKIYKGSQWVILHVDFVTWIHEDPAGVEHFITWQEYFRTFQFPDESFFQTLVMSSPRKFKRYAETGLVKLFQFSEHASHMYVQWNDCKTHVNPRPNLSPCYLGVMDAHVGAIYNHLFYRKAYYQDEFKVLLRENLWENELYLD